MSKVLCLCLSRKGVSSCGFTMFPGLWSMHPRWESTPVRGCWLLRINDILACFFAKALSPIWSLQLLQLSCACHSCPRYNCDNGGPAPEKLTNQIFQNTKSIAKYYIASDELTVDISKIGTSSFMVQHHDTAKFGDFTVKVRFLQQPAMTADCGVGPKRWPRKLRRDLHSAAACAHLKVRLRLALHI